jgi:transposase
MEKELKYEIRKISPKSQEEVRKKIIREKKKRGDSKEVAEICECTVQHVNRVWKKYQDGGIEAILAVKMGRPIGEGKKLTVEQESEIKQLLTDNTPSDLGLNCYLWSRGAVCELVKQKYGIEIAVRTVGTYLARWNFTYQRPKKKITAPTRKP